MVDFRQLLWNVLGRASANRVDVDVRQLSIPSPQSTTEKIHVPTVDELPSPDVTRDLLEEIQGPNCVAPTHLPFAVAQDQIDFLLSLPPVHGRLLGREVGDEEEADGDPMELPPTIERTEAEPTEEDLPYLPADLLILLLPPASDLVGITFDWPADLYPFQVEGVRFLTRRRHALLADDMGLGKTVQTIAAIRILLKAGWIRNVLVVCPASIKTNWLAEFNRWAPEIQCEVVDGDVEERKWCWGYPCHVLITNYRSLINDYDYGFCDTKNFDIVVLDEAQRIKNPGTKTAQTAKLLRRKSSWCLTGTPVENSADDMRSIFQFVHPGLQLQHAFSSELRSNIEPYFLRRRKEEVLDELPPKRLADRWLSLTPAQATAYEKAEKEGVAFLRDLGHQITITHVFALITRLKQICNFDPLTEQSCKLDYLRESIEEITAAGEKALLFSQFVETIEFLRDELSDSSPVVYRGGMSASQKDAAVSEFTENPDRPLMLISLKAGGLGLNLQAASWVFHYDRWWTPAAERQAEDRAHRIGQSKALMIERLMCEDTIEERIHQIQQRKQQIIDNLVEADYEDGMERLSTEEMFQAVGLDPELVQIAKSKST